MYKGFPNLIANCVSCLTAAGAMLYLYIFRKVTYKIAQRLFKFNYITFKIQGVAFEKASCEI